MRKIADTSNLILDPTLDTYYLMDTAVLRLPNVLLFAGRSADLATLGTKPGFRNRPAGGYQDRGREVPGFPGRGRDRQRSAEGPGLTTSTTLGPNITNQLDRFRTAVDAFVPPVNLLQSLDQVDVASVVANADRVREAVRVLNVAVLAELDRLLKVRVDKQSVRRTQGGGIGVLCLILTVLLCGC